MNIAVPTPDHKPIEDRLAQVEKALDRMGNTHSLPDILALIEDGAMQSFAMGPTWAITQILDFPRKRVLEIFMTSDPAAASRAGSSQLLQGVLEANKPNAVGGVPGLPGILQQRFRR